MDRNDLLNNSKTTEPLGYVPSLDGLRAIAALAVIVEHVYQDVPLIKAIIPGYFGVRLFFVLSGYLITSILIFGADQSDNLSAKVKCWKSFYIRRALRIFPAYYLCLLVALVLAIKVNGLQGYHTWRFAYLTNWHMALHNTGDVYYGHLWTLAVEEQFYLFWPFVILLLPARWRIVAVVGLIATGPISRSICAWVAPNEFWIRKPTWSCFDSLGFGALLACIPKSNLNGWSKAYFYRLAVYSSALLVAVGLYFRWRIGERSPAAAIFLGSAEGFLFFALLRVCIGESSGIWRYWLERRWLTTVGKVSYGLYLYHAFVMPGVSFVFRRMEWEQRHGIGLHTYFLLVVVGSITMALLSWRFFERPLNQLKSRFPYAVRSRAETPSVCSASPIVAS